MSIETQKPFFPTPTGAPIPSPYTHVNTNSIIDNLSAKLSPTNINSLVDKLSSTFKAPSVKPADIIQKLTPKPDLSSIFDINNPIYQNAKDLLQGPSLALGKFLIEPTWNFLSSGAELATGKPLPKLQLPGLTKNIPNFVDASSYQQKYKEQIDAGVPEKDAYKNTLINGIMDAIQIAEPIRAGIKLGIPKTSLIKPEITTISKETLADYFSGRKTAEQLGLSSDVKASITDKMKAMTTAEKSNFLQGFDLVDAKPSTVGKLFGVTEEEAKQIMQKSFGGPVRSASAGALPGQRAVPGQAPAFGLSTKQVENVGYGAERPKIDQLIADNKVRITREGTKDVYQYKNRNGNWVRATSEDDAVFKATKEPAPKYQPKDQQQIDFNKAQLDNVRERLAEHPARPLLKFTKEGDFQDFRNPNLAKTKTEAERIKAKNNKIMKTAENAFSGDPILHDQFDNPDAIRATIEDYRGARQVEKSLVASKKYLEENLKPISQIIRERVRQKIPLIDTQGGWGRSVEIQANQALSILRGEVYPMSVSYPQIIENTMTPVKNKVNIIDTYLRTPHFVMEKIGFGKEAQMLRDGAEAYYKELPKQIEKISKWLETLKTKEAQVAVYRWLDGKPITLPFYELEVAKQIKNWLKDWADRLNLPEDQRISHYITHIFNREIIEKEFDEELAKIITDKIPKGTYDPFLLERLGKKGYIEDLGLSLDAYAKRAVRKVHMDPALEKIRERAGVQLEFSNIEKSQFKYIQRYIENIQMRPTDKEEGIDNLIKSIIGYRLGQRPAIAILNTFRQATFRGMLGLNPTSALRNLSQGINTYAVLGEKYTALGYLNLFSKGAPEELAREGIFGSNIIQDRTLSSGKKIIQATDKVLFAMFDTVEKLNRGAAYFGAKKQALSKGMTESEAIQYAKKIVAKTQFLYDSVDTPVGMASGIAKTMFQFQTYTTKQLEFLATINQGKGYTGADKLKYAVPYLRYILAGLTFVYTIGKAFGMDPKEILPWFKFDTPPSLKAPVEIVKAVVNAPDKYGRQRDLQTKLGDVGKASIGLLPAGNQLKKTYEGIKAVNEGGSFTKAGKLQFTVGMTPAQKVQAIIFGKYSGQGAQDYFNKDKTDYSSIKPVYDKAQNLIKEGNIEEARILVNELSAPEKELYKKYKTQQKTLQTLQGKKDILPFYLKMQELKKTNVEEARRQVNALPDDQKKYYQLIKDQVEKDQKAGKGEIPTFQDGEPQTTTGLIGTVVTYAKALGTDPITAFNRIFTGQKIRYVSNGAIIVERMSLEESQKVKEQRGGKNADFKLDHLIPLELGGSNSEDNLVLVPTSAWESYSPVENYLGRKLRAGTISKKQAQDLIVKFKSGELTAKQVFEK